MRFIAVFPYYVPARSAPLAMLKKCIAQRLGDSRATAPSEPVRLINVLAGNSFPARNVWVDIRPTVLTGDVASRTATGDVLLRFQWVVWRSWKDMDCDVVDREAHVEAVWGLRKVYEVQANGVRLSAWRAKLPTYLGAGISTVGSLRQQASQTVIPILAHDRDLQRRQAS
jgi:hypothetical protein